MELVARVRRTLAERGLLVGAQRVLVACSGGPDSQALLHILHHLAAEHGCELVAAGVDHGLRPEAGDEIGLAARLAGDLGVPFQALRVTVPPGASRQAQARTVRYEVLARCAREVGAQRIAVGHTLDDQAETVVARLLRGTGIEGLGGIVARRADGVVRPLIDARRSFVHAYAARHQLPFARDPSNDDPRYLRVRVRHSLLPALSAENPHVPEQLAALAEDVREVSVLLQNEIERAKTLLEEQGIAPFLGLPQYLQRAALKSVASERVGRSIQRTHLIALQRMLRDGGQVRLPGDVVAAVGPDGRLSFSPAPKRGRGAPRRTKGTT